jgi:HTH-type transcriptional regulator/antitoxin HigA
MVALEKNNFIDTIQHCKHIAPVIHEPQNADDYDKLSSFLDKLLDMVGEDESHELMGLVDVISHMIAMYDEEHQHDEFEKATGINALKFLMEQHGLKQTDLKEIGSQGVVSEILNAKRQLNVTQIKSLSERFGVSPVTFID